MPQQVCIVKERNIHRIILSMWMYFTAYFLIGLALDMSIAECFMFIFYVDIYIVKLQIVVGMQDEKLRKAGFASFNCKHISIE